MTVSRYTISYSSHSVRGSQDGSYFDVPRPRTSLIDGLGTSQRESFHIFFTLHIYYNIFFLKNQICYIYLASRRSFFDLTLLYPSELHPSYQGTEVPLSSHLRHLARWGKGGWTRTNDLRHHKLIFESLLPSFMEKVVYGERKWTVHFAFFTLHIYYNIFFFESQKEFLT